MGGDFADTIDGAVVEARSAVGLRLQTDANVLNRAGNGGVGDSGKGSREVVLRVGEVRLEGVGGGVEGFKAAACPMEGSKLDRDLVW